LNREVPRNSLEFIIKCFGGEVSWENSGSYEESDTRITHQIIDRNIIQTMFQNRDYIQPQWVYDSINENILLPVVEYSISKKLPPHLSPFVNDEKSGYIPERRETLNSYLLRKIQGEELEQNFVEEQQSEKRKENLKHEKKEEEKVQTQRKKKFLNVSMRPKWKRN